jgi:hypothetical protein
MPPVKYWEVIADNLSKAGWSWAASQLWILRVEQFGLLTRIAAMESVSFCVRMKSCPPLFNSHRGFRERRNTGAGGRKRKLAKLSRIR